jgi:hypothetical protein
MSRSLFCELRLESVYDEIDLSKRIEVIVNCFSCFRSWVDYSAGTFFVTKSVKITVQNVILTFELVHCVV